MAAPAAPPRSFRAAGALEAMRAAALGGNLWIVALVLPMLHGGARGVLDWVLAVLPLAPLALGALALGSPTNHWPPRVLAAAQSGPRGRASADNAALGRMVATGALLFGFPVALATVLATRTDLADREAWGALGLSAVAGSTLAYGALAAEACSRPLGLRVSSATSLSVLGAHEPSARTWLRRGVLGMATLGAIGIAIVAPALGSRASLLQAWGEAADEATVLASIVGAAAGAFSLAVVLGPRLRAPRPGERLGPAVVRVSFALTIACVAGLAALVLRAASRG